MSIRAVTIAEMEQAVITVYRECNGNLPLKFQIRETAEELYGYENVKQQPELKSAQGAYFPKLGIVAFASTNILYDSQTTRGDETNIEASKGVAEAIRVVRHEVLGHYGLNTCNPEQKLNILAKIVDSRQNPSLYGVWQEIERSYPNITKIRQAEEVFSFVAEDRFPIEHSFSLMSEPFTLKHIEQISARISEGIRLGKREQLIFPETNDAQFFDRTKSETLITSYKWSKDEAKMIVSINDKQPNLIPEKTLTKIMANDKFLSNYSLATVNTGKLDLTTATGMQPIPRLFDKSGNIIQIQEVTQPIILK